MLLSEMFGVKRDTEFGVKGYEAKFKIICGCTPDGEDLERIFYTGFNGWSMLQSIEVFCTILRGAPAGIIHLPPPLTDEQRVVLMSLFTMGARYMGMTQDGWKRCFVNKPQKEFSGWTCGDTQALTIAHGMANCLDSLVSWSDHEPYDIGKALGVGE